MNMKESIAIIIRSPEMGEKLFLQSSSSWEYKNYEHQLIEYLLHNGFEDLNTTDMHSLFLFILKHFAMFSSTKIDELCYFRKDELFVSASLSTVLSNILLKWLYSSSRISETISDSLYLRITRVRALICETDAKFLKDLSTFQVRLGFEDTIPFIFSRDELMNSIGHNVDGNETKEAVLDEEPISKFPRHENELIVPTESLEVIAETAPDEIVSEAKLDSTAELRSRHHQLKDLMNNFKIGEVKLKELCTEISFILNDFYQDSSLKSDITIEAFVMVNKFLTEVNKQAEDILGELTSLYVTADKLKDQVSAFMVSIVLPHFRSMTTPASRLMIKLIENCCKVNIEATIQFLLSFSVKTTNEFRSLGSNKANLVALRMEAIHRCVRQNTIPKTSIDLLLSNLLEKNIVDNQLNRDMLILDMMISSKLYQTESTNTSFNGELPEMRQVWSPDIVKSLATIVTPVISSIRAPTIHLLIDELEFVTGHDTMIASLPAVATVVQTIATSHKDTVNVKLQEIKAILERSSSIVAKTILNKIIANKT